MNMNEILFCRYVSSLDWTTGKTKHDQTHKCFLRAATLRIDPQKAFLTVEARIQASSGELNVATVHRQLLRAYEYVAGQAGRDVTFGPTTAVKEKKRQAKGEFCPDKLKRIAYQAALDDPVSFLRSRSVLPPEAVTSQHFLNMLYRPGEKVIVFTEFKSQGQMLFMVGHSADQSLPTGGINGVWFLTNPVDGNFHRNPRQNYKSSRRSEESITAWRYLLLESDEADERDWMSALVQIPLPIVSIYSSGGRSIHALVRIDAHSKAEWDATKEAVQYTVRTLGACKGALSAVRLSRLPQCWRGNKLQELIYINSAADGTPILELPDREHRPLNIRTPSSKKEGGL